MWSRQSWYWLRDQVIIDSYYHIHSRTLYCHFNTYGWLGKETVVASSSFRSIAHAVPFIPVAVFVVFSPTSSNEFVNRDDYDYIVNNQLVKTFDITNILRLFNFNTQVPGNYHPLTISYSPEYQFAGDRPFRYHFGNILLHLTNTVLFLFLPGSLPGLMEILI